MLRFLARQIGRAYNNYIGGKDADRIIERAESVLSALEKETRTAELERQDYAAEKKNDLRVAIQQFAVAKAQIRAAQRLNLITAIAAAFALLAAGGVIWSVFEARDATNEASRAWAGIARADHGDLQQGHPMYIQLTLINTGQEPALRAVYSVKVFSTPHIPTHNGNAAAITAKNKACDGLRAAREGEGTSLWHTVFHDSTDPNDPKLGAAEIPLMTSAGDQKVIDAAILKKVSMIVDTCLVYWTGGASHMTAARFLLRDTDDDPANWGLNLIPSGTFAD